MAGGRPTKYTDELVKNAWAYVNGGWEEAGDVTPTVAGMACEIGVVRETCHEWARDESKEFSNILMALMQQQERVLVNNGLMQAFSAPITKMMLTKHGYSDRIEQDNTSSDGSMTPTMIERVIVKPDGN